MIESLEQIILRSWDEVGPSLTRSGKSTLLKFAKHFLMEFHKTQSPFGWYNPHNGECGQGIVDFKDTGCIPLYKLPEDEQ